MDWYYAEGDDRIGPLTEDEFSQAVSEKRVVADTLVWNSEMGDEWVLYEQLATSPVPSTGTSTGPGHTCVECGSVFDPDDVIEFQGVYVCGPCKPIFFQRIKEGGNFQGGFEFAGFWIRFGAKIIDGILLYVVNLLVMIPLTMVMATAGEEAAIVAQLLLFIFTYGIQILYSVLFLGKFGATPGKMAVGIKVVRSDGEQVSYLRAFGRYFAEILSGLIFLIGYIMAAFDDEKRALHDRICDTRVVRVR